MLDPPDENLLPSSTLFSLAPRRCRHTLQERALGYRRVSGKDVLRTELALRHPALESEPSAVGYRQPAQSPGRLTDQKLVYYAEWTEPLQDKLTPKMACRASISVSMPACHAGEQGSTPWRGVERHPAQIRAISIFAHDLCTCFHFAPAKASLNQ